MTLKNFDIILILIKKFERLGIYRFSKKELEQQLIYLTQNKKYASILPEKINIEDSIDMLTKCGYLSMPKYDNDTIYILKTCEQTKFNIRLNLFIEAYCNNKKLCDNYQNLNFFIKNPNDVYTLVKGNDGKKQIEWTINTDGRIIDRKIKLVKGIRKTFKDPFTNSSYTFNEADFTIVEVQDASYVIWQKIVNNFIEDNMIYLDENNTRKIDSVAKIYCKRR